MKPTLIYCYDAYCGWCYGFSEVMKKINSEYKSQFEIEVLSGGMILPGEPVSIGATAGYISKAYKILLIIFIKKKRGRAKTRSDNSAQILYYIYIYIYTYIYICVCMYVCMY